MKKLTGVLLLLAFLWPAFSVWAQPHTGNAYLFCYFNNNGEDGLHLAYSTDGYHWKALFNDSSILKPAVSKDKLMRDPCIIKGGDGLYHMVWTVSWTAKGIGYATSPDLIHWSEQRYLPVMEHEPEARNSWAPEITYDPTRQEYMIYWASTIPDRFPQTDPSEEDNYNHRIYFTTTKDFNRFSETKLLYDPHFSAIDATIVKDGKRYVMFFKNEVRSPAEKNIRAAFSEKLTGPYGAPGPPITGNYWAEGPTSLKIGNNWIVYFDKYTEQKYGAVTSTDLIHWTDISDKVQFPKGIRHGTAFTVPGSEFQKLMTSLNSMP